MSSPEHVSDPLFWPLLFFTVLACVFVVGMVAGVVALVKVLARPGHHPQRAEGGGNNYHDASSPTTINVRDIHVGHKGREAPGKENAVNLDGRG